MAETHIYSSLADKLLLNFNVVVVVVLFSLLIYYSSKIYKFIGKTVVNVTNKVMGLIVIAIAIEMLTKGL